jgi:hypothetical protein
MIVCDSKFSSALRAAILSCMFVLRYIAVLLEKSGSIHVINIVAQLIHFICAKTT